MAHMPPRTNVKTTSSASAHFAQRACGRKRGRARACSSAAPSGSGRTRGRSLVISPILGSWAIPRAKLARRAEATICPSRSPQLAPERPTMPDGPGQASPDLASNRRDPPSAPVERFEPGRFRDELVEAEHLVRYLWAAGVAAGREALDAGCGTGYGCALLAERGGAARCLGVDISEDAVADARATHGADERLEFAVG